MAASSSSTAGVTRPSLRTAVNGLAIPPLTPLTTEHVLSRAFYLLSQYPGRTDGDTVWVAGARATAATTMSARW